MFKSTTVIDGKHYLTFVYPEHKRVDILNYPSEGEITVETLVLTDDQVKDLVFSEALERMSRNFSKF